MILIISIPKAGERMLPTTPPLSYPPPPNPAVTACEEFKVQSLNVYKPFCVKTLSYVTLNYYCFCFPCKYFLCSYAPISYAPIFPMLLYFLCSRIDVQINITNSKFHTDHTDLLSPWFQEIRFQNVHQLSVRFLQIPKPWH